MLLLLALDPVADVLDGDGGKELDDGGRGVNRQLPGIGVVHERAE